jgi:hypothetical protein
VDLTGITGQMNRMKSVVTVYRKYWFDRAAIPGMISSTNRLDVKAGYQPTDFNDLTGIFNQRDSQIGDTINNTTC